MSVALILIAFGIVNWFGTLLVVDSEFFAPVRNWVARRAALAGRKWTQYFWDKADYMINCHMCAGTWVALALAPFAPIVIASGFVGYILTSLLIKGLGHLILVLHHLGESKTRENNAAADSMESGGHVEYMTMEEFEKKGYHTQLV